MQRRLAAILVADVVGYSRLMEANEVGTLTQLREIRAGLVDGLSSDYMPISLLEAAFLVHDELEIPLPEAIAKISLNPARMVGLCDRGEIAIGKRADLIRVHRGRIADAVREVWRLGRRVL